LSVKMKKSILVITGIFLSLFGLKGRILTEDITLFSEFISMETVIGII